MKKILSYRAMGSLCRQQAVFHPENSWKWLGDAERWEHLAHAEIASHFKECNASSSNASGSDNSSSNDLAPAEAAAPSDANATRWETVAAA
jgi:hypothetical protein